MATFTSVKSGYWNDPTVWDLNAVPADGDSVTVASGHTVIFNVDQTSFTNGLAGLTINGTLKIPSQAEDSSMPNFVCLKVNANIAGSGSFLIGSSTYPIVYPQSVKVMVNGTISVATFNAYGEQRQLRTFVAQPASSGSSTIVLVDDLQLRVGDEIAVGIDTPGTGGDFFFTVTAYNASTKTVTISPSLSRARNTKALVLLMTRQIVVQKYGSNSGDLVTGSARTLVGVNFDNHNVNAWVLNISSSSITQCTFTRKTNQKTCIGGSNNTVTDCNACSIYMHGFVGAGSGTNITVTNTAVIGVSGGALGMHDFWDCSFINCFVQNASSAVDNGGQNIYLKNCWVANVGGFITTGGYAQSTYAEDCTFLGGGHVVPDSRVIVRNITLSSTAAGAPSQLGFGDNLYGATWSGFTVQLVSGLANRLTFRNLNGAFSAPSFHGGIRSSNPRKCYYYAQVIGINGEPKAYVRYFINGYVKNRYDASPPDFSTFQFYLTDTSSPITPIYFDVQCRASQITVQGTITQLGTNEQVKVQIFSPEKEPILGDTPNFEQTYTSTGDINISWTPPYAGTWIVRILAYLQQTTNPITIQNLQVSGGGGGGGTPTTVEVSHVFVG